MGHTYGGQQRSNPSILILSLLLLASNVHKTDQQGVIPASGCSVTAAPLVHFTPHEDAPPAVNTKILKCNNVSTAILNRDYFKSDSSVAYKEIVLTNMNTDDYLNVIHEDQTETLRLIGSTAHDRHLQKLFQNKNFVKLRVLDVSDNQIQSLDRDLFQRSIQLHTLNLGRNEIQKLPGNVFGDLTELRELRLNNNKFIDFSFGPSVFSQLRQLNILDLSNNTIIDIERHMFYGLESLIEINLSHNKLYILPYQVFESMNSIEVVDLSHNLLMSFLDNFFIYNHKLRVLQLHHNLMGKINKNSLYGLKELHTLDLSFNQLLTVDRNAFDTLDSLRYLNLANNQIQLLSANVFLSLKRLQSLDLSNNQMERLPLGIFAHQFELNEVFLDNTNLFRISNWISKVNTNATINKSVLRNLKLVSLKNSTRLRVLESCFLQNMPSLEKLFVTKSQLTFLPKGIDEMPGLKELDLSDNRLEFIPPGIQHLFDLNSVNLLGNDLQCDCHMYWMLQWIDELKIKNKSLPYDLLRLSEMKCRNGYRGDIIRVLQNINCVKPHLISATKDQTYPLFTDAVLECSFAGNPAPEIVWRTPHGEILRHDEGEVDTTAKFQLKQLHKSLLKDTPENNKYQQIIDTMMKNENSSRRHGPGITLLENGTLTVHNISRLDAGLFTCFALNIMGNATTDVR